MQLTVLLCVVVARGLQNEMTELLAHEGGAVRGVACLQQTSVTPTYFIPTRSVKMSSTTSWQPLQRERTQRQGGCTGKEQIIL